MIRKTGMSWLRPSVVVLRSWSPRISATSRPRPSAPTTSRRSAKDAFLLDQLDLRPAEVIDALRRQVSRHHREPRTIEALLAILGSPGSGCPDFVLACHQML